MTVVSGGGGSSTWARSEPREAASSAGTHTVAPSRRRVVGSQSSTVCSVQSVPAGRHSVRGSCTVSSAESHAASSLAYDDRRGCSAASVRPERTPSTSSP